MLATTNLRQSPPTRAHLIAGIVGILLATSPVAQPVAAGRGDGLDFRYSADGFWTISSGCLNTFVGIFPVFESRRGPSGQPSAGSSISLQLEQRDTCAGTDLLRGQGGQGLPDDAFRINQGLAKAELHATDVTVCDSVSGSCFPLSIDLTYRRIGGRGECSTQGDLDTELTTFCSAKASGVVSDGTTNYTPVPADVAVLQMHQTFTG